MSFILGKVPNYWEHSQEYTHAIMSKTEYDELGRSRHAMDLPQIKNFQKSDYFVPDDKKWPI